ncbi:hypothetical protein RU07_22370 [Agrobacterium tumefaciens]|uniref:Uncharacterized protein n=1 Tax=Agrobacterium tumefaciens TaxID=358 RepID=A0A0D0KFP5_AGRTU|nr:hypothetical protein RU07_22370 [Agrobacterium tumefaciens]
MFERPLLLTEKQVSQRRLRHAYNRANDGWRHTGFATAGVTGMGYGLSAFGQQWPKSGLPHATGSEPDRFFIHLY